MNLENLPWYTIPYLSSLFSSQGAVSWVGELLDLVQDLHTSGFGGSEMAWGEANTLSVSCVSVSGRVGVRL